MLDLDLARRAVEAGPYPSETAALVAALEAKR